LKVAILTRDFPPVTGGISTHVGALVGGLRTLGVDVDVYVGRTDYRTLLMPFSVPLRDYDIVHVQSGPYGAFVVGAPLVVTVHAPLVLEWTDYSGTQKMKSLSAYALERATLRRARAILAVSETTKRDLEMLYRIPRERVSVIGSGVDYERYSSTSEDQRVLKRVLVVSRLENRKNVGEGLRALGNLPSESYELEIVGEGSQAGSLLAMARVLGVNAKFSGRVAADKLPGVYGRAGIFLSTSRSEGFGLSLLEGMAAGCAIIASDIPAHRHLVSDGRNGLLYHGRPELEAALRRLLNDPVSTRKMGGEAKSVALSYSWSEVSKRALAAYSSALSVPQDAIPSLRRLPSLRRPQGSKAGPPKQSKEVAFLLSFPPGGR